MIYVFNKNKIFSCVVAFFIVFTLFAFSTSVIPNKDIELLKVSANSTNNTVHNNIEKDENVKK